MDDQRDYAEENANRHIACGDAGQHICREGSLELVNLALAAQGITCAHADPYETDGHCVCGMRYDKRTDRYYLP